MGKMSGIDSIEGKRDQHWYYSSIVKVLIPRKKECKLIGELEKEVKAVFGTLETI